MTLSVDILKGCASGERTKWLGPVEMTRSGFAPCVSLYISLGKFLFFTTLGTSEYCRLGDIVVHAEWNVELLPYVCRS